VPTETAPRVVAATRLPIGRHAATLRAAGFDAAGYERLKARVLDRVREPMTPPAARQAVAMDGEVTVGLRIMAREGLVLRVGGSLRADNPRYVATEAWLGRPLADADPEAALAWLADAYLRGYGPARVADFAWWSGVPKRRSAAAIAANDAVDLGGGLLLPADLAEAFGRVAPVDAEAVVLLPKWDAYTMGYAPDGRQRLIADADLGSAYTLIGKAATAGDGLPLVLRGGQAVASWSHRFAGDRMLVRVTPFANESVPPVVADGAFAGVGRLLGATAIQVEVATTPDAPGAASGGSGDGPG